MNKSFIIGIPTINRADLLNKALAVYATKFPNTQIIVLDNGKTQEIAVYPNVRIIRVVGGDGFGLGVAASWNRLCNIIFQEATHALILNDDVVLNCEEADIVELIHTPNIDFALGHGFGSFLLPAKTFHGIGGFDEKFIRAYYEDSDYFYRMKIHGLSIAHRQFLIVKELEKGSSSSRKNSQLSAYSSTNEIRYIEKWGGKPHIEKFKTPFNIPPQKKDYLTLCNTPTDITAHLPVFKKYAEQCKHITEFGVRDVVSTYAFIESGAVIRSYDIEYSPNMKPALEHAKKRGVDLKFIIRDTLYLKNKQGQSVIDETDFLFIDTLHIYKQLREELKLHGNKAKKYLAFHDVYTFGYCDEISNHSPTAGLLPAIFEFLCANKHWSVDYFSTASNGLLVLKRI